MKIKWRFDAGRRNIQVAIIIVTIIDRNDNDAQIHDENRQLFGTFAAAVNYTEKLCKKLKETA